MPRDEEPSRHRHGRAVSGGQAFWWVDRLWMLAEALPSFEAYIDDIAEFDMDCWFGDWAKPTCRAVALHARRMADADLRYPIILSASGALFDGAHRVAKAWMTGRSTVLAVQFEATPRLTGSSARQTTAGNAGSRSVTGRNPWRALTDVLSAHGEGPWDWVSCRG
jgi:hypothetical protein